MRIMKTCLVLTIGLVGLANVMTARGASDADQMGTMLGLAGASAHLLIPAFMQGEHLDTNGFARAIHEVTENTVKVYGDFQRTRIPAVLATIMSVRQGVGDLLFEASAPYLRTDGSFRQTDFNNALYRITDGQVLQLSGNKGISIDRAFIQMMKGAASADNTNGIMGSLIKGAVNRENTPP